MQRLPNSKSRRKTLGPVVNQGSRRQSIDPGVGGRVPKQGTNQPRSRSRGRQSMIPRMGRENVNPSSSSSSSTTPSTATTPQSSTKLPSLGGRRHSSIGVDRRQSIPAPAVSNVADPRPVGDKNFQLDCMKKLLQYLVQSGYEHPISHKTLARPSGKDFTNIITFMLRRADPSFQDGTMKMEDEVAMVFKAMGYPFPVSKTALVAAGSPHTWPTLLAALTWLMERLQLTESIESEAAQEDDGNGQYESLEELEEKTDKAFFKYLGAAYTAFLEADDHLTEQLENALVDRLGRDDAIIQQEIEEMTDKNAAIVEQLHDLTEGSHDLNDYTKKRDGYRTDNEQFIDLIKQMDQHVATLTKKKEERAQSLAETSRKLARANTHIEELKKAIDLQALSLEDVHKMQNEQKGVEEGIERAIKLKEQRRKALWESESTFNTVWNELESYISEYNALLGELKLLPLVSAKNVPMKIVVNKDVAHENDQKNLLGVDLQSSVHPTLLSLKKEYTEKLSEAKWKYQESLDKLEDSQEALTEAMEKLKIIQDKTSKCEETLEAERQAQEAKLAVRLREVKAIEGKVESVRDPVALEEQMARYERQVAELEILRTKYEEETVARKQAVCNQIEAALQLVREYEEFFSQKVAEVKKYQMEKKDSYGKLKVPPNVIDHSD